MGTQCPGHGEDRERDRIGVTKLLAQDDRRRPQDHDDLHRLIAVAPAVEIERAREAIRLIEARGFHRGRDLAMALNKLLSA